MAHITVTLYHRGYEFDVDVEGDVVSDGINNYGSDEPAWCDVEGVTYTHPQRDRPLSPILVSWIEKNHGDDITERLIEADNEW